MSWEDAGYVAASKNRRAVLLKLSDTPCTPTVLARVLEMNVANVSRTLTELDGRNLVVCLNPTKRVGRIYALTDKGKKITERVRKMQ